MKRYAQPVKKLRLPKDETEEERSLRQGQRLTEIALLHFEMAHERTQAEQEAGHYDSASEHSQICFMWLSRLLGVGDA